ncbi:MAG TPA: DUF4386 domain-containing protein [Thermoanaerobaculia bacterium]|jgi:hypothetical protein|nr:DUF4386 domain-containing protein [Thermoanaerobaculia bacterium]
MTTAITESSPRLKARIAGLCYLLMLPTGGLAMYVRARYVIKGDAATTAANMMAHEPMFRLAFAGDLLVVAIYILFTALMYDLMKPVSRNISMLAAFFSLMGCATQAFACLFELAPLIVLTPDPYLGTFNPAQLHSLAYLSLKLYAATYGISLVFFGFYNLTIGYLVYKSTFLPRILGVLMAISCAVGMTFLWPPFATQYFRYLLILDVGELLLVLWLLVMGVNAKRWWEQADAMR